MEKVKRKHAPTPAYMSPNQLTLDAFKSPFERELNPSNRWVVLAGLIPWDEISSLYLKNVPASNTGRPALNPRIVIGSLIIKHMCNLDDREAVDQIAENIYMQYFLGYTSFIKEPPFDASLFVDFRKKLGMDSLNAINEKIAELKADFLFQNDNRKPEKDDHDSSGADNHSDSSQVENKGRIIFDATACPQDIAYPTDLDLLSDAREKSEQLIDQLYNPVLHKKKPRTYRKIARHRYLKTAQKKNKTHKEIRKATGSQLGFLKRNLNSINRLLDSYKTIPLKHKNHKYLLVINTLYAQQKEMYSNGVHRIDDRIVSIHQPHVRPIVRGKSQAKVEFGAKIHLSLIDGISFLDQLSWDAFNEGSHMMEYIEKYRNRFGFYPKEVLADQIYCNRINRAALKEKGIKLLAKPLGRPSAVQKHVSPGERNPIEGKFGQAKTAYGLNRVKARLRETSESWIACIILVLNLVKLAGVALPYLIVNLLSNLTAQVIKICRSYSYQDFQIDLKIIIQMLYSKQVELKNLA
ncbi:MAG: IS5 family transposase [Bacteroidia bacterium]|nr:IS5 family transposase [Bacteroidia bacterium]